VSRVKLVAAGIATTVTRYEQLQYLAQTYYHLYLVQAGLSDGFYIWYFLLSESLLALSFAVTGGIIALHGPATWMTFFAAIALMLFGASVPLNREGVDMGPSGSFQLSHLIFFWFLRHILSLCLTKRRSSKYGCG